MRYIFFILFKCFIIFLKTIFFPFPLELCLSCKPRICIYVGLSGPSTLLYLSLFAILSCLLFTLVIILIFYQANLPNLPFSKITLRTFGILNIFISSLPLYLKKKKGILSDNAKSIGQFRES